ncbi:response regulator [Bacillus gobiensis]|uniref:response regulator n=1 Tax=Bacillus gobiensis TaxID=1441095 RepID=UPI003D22611E
MKVYILFYLWIIPILVGIISSFFTYKASFRKRFYPAYTMIGLAVLLLIAAFIVRNSFDLFISGLFLFATMLAGSAIPFFLAFSKKKRS